MYATIVGVAEIVEAVEVNKLKLNLMKNGFSQTEDFFVQYHITHRCNLHCSHCYQKDMSRDNELTFSEICSSLNEISDMIKEWRGRYCDSLRGVIQLTGGEPLCRPDWQEIVQHCSHNSFEIILMTNGTLLEEETVRFIAENDIDVQVSLDGFENTNDKIRGIGTHKKVMNGISLLQNANIDFSVSFTLMKSNLHELYPFIKSLDKQGVRRVGISRYLPINAEDKQLLDKSELYSTYKTIHNNSYNNIIVSIRDPLFNIISSTPSANSEGGCSIGFWGFCILSDGNIVPCSRLNIPIGNIKEDSIREVWATSQFLWDFRTNEKLNDKCKNCSYKSTCKGCRAVAYKVNGDYFSQDPICWLQ